MPKAKKADKGKTLENYRPRYELSFVELLGHLSQTFNPMTIAREFNVSDDLVRYYKRKIAAFGTVQTPIELRGRPRKLLPAMEDRLREYIAAAEQSPTLDEMQTLLIEEYGVSLDPSSIWRALERMRVSHKKGERVYPNKDPDLRAGYLGRIISNYTARQMIFVDESASNERGLDRRYGWSPRGTAYKMTMTAQNRSKSWSILPAIGINGYLHYEIIQGGYDSERFINFIRGLLPKMQAFPGPRSVLVMDNCSTHHSKEVGLMCQQAGVVLEYLPPYSPDYNPIEQSFSTLKSWIRRNRSLATAAAGEQFGGFLHLAVMLSDVRKRARGYFKACQIPVTDEDVDVDYNELQYD